MFPQDYKYHYDFPFNEIFWATPDGQKINGIQCKNTHNTKGVVLFFHGNSGHMGRSANYFKRVRDYDYDLVLYDYRGYGKSTGKITAQSFYDDALLVYDWVVQQYAGKPIIIHGLSIGCHFAIYTASKRKPDMLILDAPFFSLRSVAKYRYPLIPASLMVRYPFDNSLYINDVNCPIYIFHGTYDKVVPMWESENLKAIKDLHLIAVSRGTHTDLHEYMEYNQIFHEILKSVGSQPVNDKK